MKNNVDFSRKTGIFRMSTTNQVFEQFIDVDIRETTLHGLVETLRQRRDFSERGIEAMLMIANAKRG